MFQTGALGYRQKAGLEQQYSTLAEKLNGLGYVSHMLGK